MCLWSHRLGESSVGDISRPACSFLCLPVDCIVHLIYFKRLVNYHISIISEYIQERLIPRRIQMFPNSPLGPRRASSTAFCHQCRCTSSGLSMYVFMYVCMLICIGEVPFSNIGVASDSLGLYLLQFFLPHRIPRQFASYWPRFPSS